MLHCGDEELAEHQGLRTMADNLPEFDVAVVGGGVVGLATAMALSRRDISLVLVEAESELAAHQTGHNSGVIHSGLYYKPGSLKAGLCVRGRNALYEFCSKRGIPCDKCGKVVVATDHQQITALDELYKRGTANGLQGLTRLDVKELKEFEPHVHGVAALLVPETGIVDYKAVTNAYADVVREAGQSIRKNSRVCEVRRVAGKLELRTASGTITCKNLVNCCGLQSDRLARMCGIDPCLKIVPFRGEYYELIPDRYHLVRNLVYPVPDPKFPFLGVHFTRMIDGSVEAGPNAVLSFKREGYSRWSFSIKDTLSFAAYSGFWRMVAKHWRMSLGEMHRSWSKDAFVKALQNLIPEIQADDLQPAVPGVRAQALEKNGALVDDFRIIKAEHMVHVLNAPSPAATASISIGEYIAEQASEYLHLP